ncbi:phage major capsid protein, partial [Enterococcus faecalis]
QRLSDLKGQIESGEVREADLDSINEEIDGLIDELKGIKEELDEVSTDEEPSDENNVSENSDTTVAAATDTDGEGRSTEV